MGRVLLGLVAAGLLVAAGAWIGVWWSARGLRSAATPTDRELAFRERMAILDHHTELLERSRRAALDGEPGLANIYREAADRVLALGADDD